MSKDLIDVQWAFVSIFAASLAHFILRIVLGRQLGPEGLGVYTLAFTVYLLGMQFAAFGIGSALTKYVAEFTDDEPTIRKYVSSGMTSSIVTGLIMGVVLFLLASYISVSFFKIPELEPLIQLTAICFPFIAIQKAVLGTLNGFRRMHLYAFLNLIQNIGIVVVSVALVMLAGMGVLGAVIGFVIPTVLIGILSPFLIRNNIGFDRLSLFDITALQATTIFGFFVVLGNSMSFISTQIDSIMIGYYLNPAEVGIYAVAALLAQTLTLIPSAVQRVTAPVTTTLYMKGDIIGARKIIFSTMKKCFLVSISISLFIAIFGQYFITILFTNKFVDSYNPLLILLIGQTVFAPFMAVGATLGSIGKVHVPVYIFTITGILNIVLNILLIPKFGIMGAATASTVTMIISFGINTALMNKYLQSKET